MRNAKLYRQYAAECRRIAQTMSPEQKIRLLEIAEAWEVCARDAEKEQASDEEEPAQNIDGGLGQIHALPGVTCWNAHLRGGITPAGNRRRAWPVEQSRSLERGGRSDSRMVARRAAA
jgi:hypothetical protein